MEKEISSPGELMELVNAFRISRIILSAYEMKIFTVIRDQALTSAEIAGTLALDPRAADRFLNAITACGLLRKRKNRFSNTPFTLKHLVEDAPAFMKGLSHQVHLWKTWNSLTRAVEAGTSVVVDEPIGNRCEEWLESFIAAMHFRGVPQSKEAADLLDLANKTRVLDVGGGSGAFVFEFIRRNPQIKGVVFDLPAVLPITEKYIEQEGFSGRVVTMAGDYLTDDFGEGYDLVFVSAVIHINSPDENIHLIGKCSKALMPGGQLVILDHIMNEERTEPAAGAFFALNMLVGTLHGDTYTENEVRHWMQDSGLKDIARKDSGRGISLMTGIK